MHALRPRETRRLHLPRPHDPLADRGARLAGRRRRKFGRRHGRHLHMQVDPVHQRSRNPAHIAVHRPRRTYALLRRMVVIAAQTGVHRRHQRKVGGIFHTVFRPRDGHPLLLQRLPQHLQHAAPEFGQLVEKQHPVVGQRHLAGPRRLSPADQRRLRNRMVRRPERPPRQQAARRHIPSHGVYLGGLQRLFARQRRQDGRHPAGQHRLARTRRPDHQHVVTARGGYLQRTLHMRLALHIGKILFITARLRPERLPVRRHRRRHLPFAVQQSDHLLQASGPDHLDAFDHGRLRGIRRRQHQPPQSLFPRAHRHRQHAPHGFQRPVQRQLPGEHRPGKRFGIHPRHRRENPDGDRQVERRALLAQVGRSQTHDHLAARHPLPGVLERRTYALLALLHGAVRQPHEVHSQSAAGDIDLDGHRRGIDPHDRSCIGPDKHLSEKYYQLTILLPASSTVVRTDRTACIACTDRLSRTDFAGHISRSAPLNRLF